MVIGPGTIGYFIALLAHDFEQLRTSLEKKTGSTAADVVFEASGLPGAC